MGKQLGRRPASGRRSCARAGAPSAVAAETPPHTVRRSPPCATRSTVALNRRARHDFTIDETFEAGIVLTGTEIKSLRAGKANLSDAYARIERGEAWLVGAHIAPFEGGQPLQPRAEADPQAPPPPRPRSTSCSAGPRRRARRSSRSGCTSRSAAGPRSSSAWRAASSSTIAVATSPSARPGATSRASWPTRSEGARRWPTSRDACGSGRSSRPWTRTPAASPVG